MSLDMSVNMSVNMCVKRQVCELGIHPHEIGKEGKGSKLNTAPSMRLARFITWTFEHGHRAVHGGGLFEVQVDPEKHLL